MDAVLFYTLKLPDRPTKPELAGPGLEASIWQPSGLSLAPANSLSLTGRVAWSTLHHLRVFRNRDHAMVLLERDGVCVHRTLLFPPYFRFPFMNESDLQFGDLWTDPSERGRGLASTGLALGLWHAWRPGRRFWYLTEESNESSRRLAIRLGFMLTGTGLRTCRLGIRAFGQFVMTNSA